MATYEEIRSVIDGINNEVRESITAIVLATSAVRHFVKRFEDIEVHPENPNPDIFVGSGDPNYEGSWPAVGSIRRDRLLEISATGGQTEIFLTQSWIVGTFARWEADYRPLLAKMAKVSKNAVTDDFFGELRHLRNDVVHHRGVATKKNAGRCGLLAFSVGEVINLDEAAFMVLAQHSGQVTIESPTLTPA